VRLAAEKDNDANARGLWGAGAGADRRASGGPHVNRRRHQGLVALDHPVGIRLCLGDAAGEGMARQHLDSEVSRERLAQPRAENPTGGRKAERGAGRLRSQPAPSGILLSAIVSGLIIGYGPLGLLKMYGRTLYLVRYSLLTIACMLALGFVTRYSGTDATLGLAFAKSGWLYPLFGTLIGWLGVALTGSDTSSNALFGGLQRISAEQIGVSPILMAAANSSGGVMGKMIDAQSIVVASTATRWYGHEGSILRFVFFHSLALAVLVGFLVLSQAYTWPMRLLVPGTRREERIAPPYDPDHSVGLSHR
jgi:hypothetical protein